MLTALLDTHNPCPPHPTCVPTAPLLPGDVLYAGNDMASPSGRYLLTAQGDGNLVIYDTINGGHVPIWAMQAYWGGRWYPSSSDKPPYLLEIEVRSESDGRARLSSTPRAARQT